MLVRVETSRVGPARLPSAASWRGSSSFAYRIHWRSGRSGGDDAHLSENARESFWGERVTVSVPHTVTCHGGAGAPTFTNEKVHSMPGKFFGGSGLLS